MHFDPVGPFRIKTDIDFTGFGIDRFVDSIYNHIYIYVYSNLWD